MPPDPSPSLQPGKTRHKQWNRRSFLAFLGKGTAGYVLIPSVFSGCRPKPVQPSQSDFQIVALAAGTDDSLQLSSGLEYEVLIRWNDPINETEHFGFNPDFTCFLPFHPETPDDGLLWVNHEYVDPRFVSDWIPGTPKTKEQIHLEQEAVGGSIIRVRKVNGRWQVVLNDPYNKRVSGRTPIPFAWDHPVAGAGEAIGTLANCSGGLTPWGTILTCEENYDQFYGERFHGSEEITLLPDAMNWQQEYAFPPEHYGWVVEVDPKTARAQKHPALGRMAHECATVHALEDGRLVVYTGDDANDEHLYKFISRIPGSLREGTLYAANLEKGVWEPLLQEREELSSVFKDQTELLIHTRMAAKLVGATPLDRPEDIEIDPVSGHVLVSLTNNLPKDNYYGSIIKIMEKDGDHAALHFGHEVFLSGGSDSGFACPDNMAFDPQGNLWFTSDISGSKIGQGVYADLGNNALFVVPRAGVQAGEVIRVASAPIAAELTGPWFAPDGKSLFLSVQHPGETSESKEKCTSHWPDGGNAIPRPAVVVIQGPLLDELSAIRPNLNPFEQKR